MNTYVGVIAFLNSTQSNNILFFIFYLRVGKKKVNYFVFLAIVTLDWV